MNQEKIGKFISELRKENNMTQEQLAEKMGVTDKSISRWENGKTMPDLSMLPILANELKNRTDIKVGYMPQVYEDVLNEFDNVLDFLASKSKEEITKARMYLGNMNFTKDEMVGKIKDLSNGTKAKLFLLKLVLDKCNVLILDEPTRNVSPLSNPVIRKVLKEFKGTIISISHDRKYIDEVIDELYVLSKDGLIRER